MVEVELEIGTHTITWTFTGYDTLKANVEVKDTEVVCLSVFSDTKTGVCYSALQIPVAPGVHKIATFALTGYLQSAVTPTPTPTPTPKPESYDDWVDGWGGPAGIEGNLIAVGQILDGYGDPTLLGFTVTLADVGTTLDYYGGYV